MNLSSLTLFLQFWFIYYGYDVGHIKIPDS